MKSLKNIKRIAVSLGLFVVIAGLSFSADLEAAVPAYQSSSNKVVADSVNTVASVNNVKVNIKETWVGDPGITEDVTPIRVSIHNNSNEPVSLNYDQFWIVTRDGHVFSAIPPFEVNGKVNKYELGADYGIIEPDFHYNDFYVAPYYGSLYNDLGTYKNYTYYNWPYYGYYTYWEGVQTDLPTLAMKSHALPEGVIKPGGSVRGYIYFEKVNPDKIKNATFHYNLDNPQNGFIWGEITIPLNGPKS